MAFELRKHRKSTGAIMNVPDNSCENYSQFTVKNLLPYFFRGKVVHGFNRGGRSLNCPTANLDAEAVDKLPKDLNNGVYAGFARILRGREGALMNDEGVLYPIVMSIGYNPQFQNKQRSLEVHILHVFENDFYGWIIEGVVVNFVRPMKMFKSLDELIDAIEEDKCIAKNQMNDELRKEFQEHSFFS